MKDYLNVTEAAKVLNNSISKDQLYRLIREGKIPSNNVTRRILVAREDLEKFMEGTLQPAPAPHEQEEEPTLKHPTTKRHDILIKFVDANGA